MSTSVSKEPWRKFYKAALFEADKSKAAERIADAERMIVARARNLFDHPDNACAERSALDAALCALTILKLYTRVPPHGVKERAISQEAA